jgi:hypothetical protein
VALWTQLYTFESGPPRALAWTAWVFLLSAVTSLAPVVTPRRLARFWTRILPATGNAAERALTFDAELAVVRELIDGFAHQRERMFRGLRISIAVSLAGIVILAAGYVLEKAFYGP